MPSSIPCDKTLSTNYGIRSQKHNDKIIKFRLELTQKITEYYNETPTAKKCLNYLQKKYPFILPQIDHIAFRSLSLREALNFDDQLDSQYSLMGQLEFTLKKFDRFFKKSFWYKHPIYSRLFSSYITIEDNYQHRINNILNDQTLSKEERYNQLKEIDQYLAWTAIWDKSINHIAFDLSQYPDSFEDIISEMVTDLDLKMNPYPGSNSQIVTSQDGLLQQASTKADLVGNIPKAYIEFVNRKYDSETGERRDGFDPFNANELFKSTF